MEIEERNHLTKLFDVYGKLLSKKQFEVMNQFLNLDISETEFAEMSNQSRQSVYDAIRKAKTQLLSFEENCNIVFDKENCKKNLIDIKNKLNSLKTDEICKKIDDIINNL